MTLLVPSSKARWTTAIAIGLAAATLAVLPGCQTLREVANLRQVNFAIENVEDAELAGIRLQEIRDPDDVRIADVGRLGTALARGEMPMQFTLMLGADNPAENGQAARLVRMDWTLLLEDRETISGTFNREVPLPAGQVTTVPIEMRLDLLDFFERGGQDLLELALSVAGVGGEPKNVRLRARPTINTALGPIRYPRPITIDVGDVGQSRSGDSTLGGAGRR